MKILQEVHKKRRSAKQLARGITISNVTSFGIYAMLLISKANRFL
jgi:hypothetical protein